jgi:hypothetical protein
MSSKLGAASRRAGRLLGAVESGRELRADLPPSVSSGRYPLCSSKDSSCEVRESIRPILRREKTNLYASGVRQRSPAATG